MPKPGVGGEVPVVGGGPGTPSAPDEVDKVLSRAASSFQRKGHKGGPCTVVAAPLVSSGVSSSSSVVKGSGSQDAGVSAGRSPHTHTLCNH